MFVDAPVAREHRDLDRRCARTATATRHKSTEATFEFDKRYRRVDQRRHRGGIRRVDFRRLDNYSRQRWRREHCGYREEERAEDSNHTSRTHSFL